MRLRFKSQAVLNIWDAPIQQVKSALQRNGYPSQQTLATDTGVSLSTVKIYFATERVLRRCDLRVPPAISYSSLFLP
ncbi:hypothetical protein NIES4106_30600 [Fischerella sp. NIES-4106]|nr:hypothetical protein NIES4106_30600 [Fischerella sp. NIES-4106]